jgi:predicted Fe-Mo cluster-binding NifX family protein
MRVLIPVLPQKEGLIIAQHFGRAPQFAVFELQEPDKPPEVYKNPVPAQMASKTGRGRIIIDFIASKHVDMIVTKEMGSGAFYYFQNNGVKVYKTNDKYPKDALEKLKKNNLEEMLEPSEHDESSK